MRRRFLIALIIGAPILSACGGTDDNAGTSTSTRADATSDAPSTTGATSTSEATPSTAAAGSDLFGVRYCEVLTVTIDPVNSTAEVWGTQGINDCQQEAFDTIDPATIVDELGVTIALPNGPRYWMLDRIVANELSGSGEIREFGGIEMRSIAIVNLGPGVPNRKPYAEVSVVRDTEFVFEAGREIYELTAPDGSVYVMQSFSIEKDPNLTVDDLAALGGRLALPDGWTFSSRTLDDELVVEDLKGTATVVQDDLSNSYQLRSRV